VKFHSVKYCFNLRIWKVRGGARILLRLCLQLFVPIRQLFCKIIGSKKNPNWRNETRTDELALVGFFFFLDWWKYCSMLRPFLKKTDVDGGELLVLLKRKFCRSERLSLSLSLSLKSTILYTVETIRLDHNDQFYFLCHVVQHPSICRISCQDLSYVIWLPGANLLNLQLQRQHCSRLQRCSK
jgi:hypothetical protein